MANALNTFLDQAASGGFGSLFLHARDSARRADMNRRANEEFELQKARYPAEFGLRQTEVGAKDVTARARAVAADASTVSANTAAEKFRHGSDPSVIQSEHARRLALAAAPRLRPGQIGALRDDPTGADYTALQKMTDAGNANQQGSESYRRERGKGQAGIANDRSRLEQNLPIANAGNSRDIIAYRERMKAVGQLLRSQLSLGAEFVAPNSAEGKQQAALQAALQQIDALANEPVGGEAQPGVAPAPDPAAFNARVGELVGSGMSEEAAIAQAKQEFAR